MDNVTTDTTRNKQDIFHKINRNSLPNLILRRQKFHIMKDKSQTSQNMSNLYNHPIKLQMRKTSSSNNLDDMTTRTNRMGFINRYNYKIKSIKSQNFNDNEYKNNSYNTSKNDREDKKDIEQMLLMKIEEIKKELEKNENTYIYNQKLMYKNLEEKENEINSLKAEIIKEKNSKDAEIEQKLKEKNIQYINCLKEYKKEIDVLKSKNDELTEFNYENEKTIQNLEKKNRKITNKLNEINNRYNLLIKEKTKEILEAEVKDYIDKLNQKIEEKQNELNDLNEEMTFLNQENKKLKLLTSEIIQARNETEIFFMDALNEAKKDLYKMQKEKNKRGYLFPTLKSYYNVNEPKVDIRDLTPDMREKILRNLFEKINKGYEEDNFKELTNTTPSTTCS